MTIKEISAVVAGTGFEGRAAIISSRCKEGASVDLVREPHNQFDANAIAVYMHGSRLFGLLKTREKIGYIKATRAENLAQKMDDGSIKIVKAQVRSFHAPSTVKVPRVSLTVVVADNAN